MNKKTLALLFLPLLIVSFIGAQSLVELSKKERERRAAAKGKTTVVTNDDLSKVKKKPAVSAGEPALTVEEVQAENPAATETATPPVEDLAVPVNEQPPSITISPAERGNADNLSERPPAIPEGDYEQTKISLEEKLSVAKDMVDLLTTKMNALWQQFYNMDTMETQDIIQLEISETYNKLLKAQEGQVRAEEELNDFVSRPRE